MRIFGELWDAPVCDGKTAEPAPIGEKCLTCYEEIVEGDSGYIMACISTGQRMDWRPQHKECSLLTVIGHNYNLCRCSNYEGMTMKQAGKELYKRLAADSRTWIDLDKEWQ